MPDIMIPADQLADALDEFAAGRGTLSLAELIPAGDLPGVLRAYGWPSPDRMAWHAQALRSGFDNATPTHTS